MIFNWIHVEFLNNTVLDYLTMSGVFIVLLIAFAMVQKFALRYLRDIVKHTPTEIDNAVVSMVGTVNPPFYAFLAFYISIQFLQVEGILAKALNIILIIWLAYQAIVAAQVFVDYFINKKLISEKDRSSEVVGEVLRGGSRIALWTLGILFILSNVGINVTSLIAGLGIGGIAIALAAQNVLGDLFSSLAIYFDKPFVPGEFIVMGSVVGTVQKVGIKTTRIKSLSGQEIIVPNKDITSSTISNFKRMERRRIAFTFGVVYETSSEKMEKVLEIVKDVIEPMEGVTFNRVHFQEFAESSLNFEVVYHVESKDFDLYMDLNQQILLEIKKKFEKAGIEMAYPTRTVHLVQGA